MGSMLRPSSLVLLLALALAACGGGNNPTATPAPTTVPASGSAVSGGATGTPVAASARGSASAPVATGTDRGSVFVMTPAPMVPGSVVAGTAAGSVRAGTATSSGSAPAGTASATAPPDNPNIKREDFMVDFGDFQTRAQLTYPASGTGPFPTVLLLPGTGPYDLDFTLKDFLTGQEKSHIFRDIADSLTLSGYAVVRYNKHYITGPNDQLNQTVAGKFYGLSQKQLLADADKVYQAATKNPRVDAKQFVLYGWSEGTTHATQLALMHPEVAGVILQAPVAGTWKETFQYQNLTLGVGFLRDLADTNKDGIVTTQEVGAAIRANPGTVSSFAALLSFDFASLTMGMPKVNPMIDKNSDGQLDINGEIVPYYQNFFATYDQQPPGSPYAAYTPDKTFPPITSALPMYKGPVLILQGANDANVDPAGAKRIDDALATGGSTDHTLLNYPGLGHSLGPCVSVYADNFQPIDAQPRQDTAGWLDKRSKK